ncbi:MAG: hypothetical protein C4293_14950, partial [Nitrospiraceae bacterium]
AAAVDEEHDRQQAGGDDIEVPAEERVREEQVVQGREQDRGGHPAPEAGDPAYDRDVTAGWIAVRDPYFYLALDYFHTKLPVRKFDRYDYNFPLVPEAPHAYLLYFEPGRFWVSEPTSGRHAADFRGFLRSGSAPIGR